MSFFIKKARIINKNPNSGNMYVIIADILSTTDGDDFC